MTRRLRLIIALCMLPVGFAVLVSEMASDWRAYRLDLTDNKIYTLSEGSKTLLGGLSAPINATVYFSDQTTENLPALRYFSERVRQLLEEMASYADGQLLVSWRDPVPYSDAEDQAILSGLSALPLGVRASDVYFGIVFEGPGGEAVLPFISPQREHLLEYELALKIDQATQRRRARVGLVSSIAIENRVIGEQLADRYDIIPVDLDSQRLPQDLDLLMLLQPPPLSEALQQAIQGAVKAQLPMLVLVDPLVQSEPSPMPAGQGVIDILAMLGVGLEVDQFVADRVLGLQVTLQPDAPPIRHPAILGLTQQQLSSEDPITSGLDAVNVATAGALTIVDPETEASSLWRSSAQSSVLPITRLLGTVSVEVATSQILEEISSDGGSYLMAMRLQAPTQAIIVADVDFLFDRYWVNRQVFLGTELMESFAGNGSFVLNALDNLVGDPALISLRSREPSYRPFTLIDEMRLRAEAQLLSTELALETALEKANANVANWRGVALEDIPQAERIELQASLERRLDLRQQLRQVQRDLDRDIEALRAQLTWINILFMPIVLCLWVITQRRWRHTRR